MSDHAATFSNFAVLELLARRSSGWSTGLIAVASVIFPMLAIEERALGVGQPIGRQADRDNALSSEAL
jgi:hypothetical protein